MRIDPDTCRDPVLLAAEVRRLRAVIAAGPLTLFDAEREALAWAEAAAANVQHPAESVLRSLWERLGGGEDR